jgi:hypothetical protein
VHLADHGVSRHPAEPSGNLAGGQTIRPQLLQQFDPLVVPGHAIHSRCCDIGGTGRDARSPPLAEAGQRAQDTHEVRANASRIGRQATQQLELKGRR